MKKYVSAFLSVMMAMSVTANAYYDVYRDDATTDEIVTFIVELEDDAVLATEAAEDMGRAYLDTYKGRAAENRLEGVQSQVYSDIADATDNEVTLGYTYTSLFNGFSIDAPRSMRDEIENTDGVRAVYESMEMEAYTPSAAAQTSSLPTYTMGIGSDEDGYTGAGQAVAIIDTEFQADHAMFYQQLTDTPITKDEAEAVKKGAYYSSKIPFCYDYYAGDSDTRINYDKRDSHGTHVAAIAGGQNLGIFFSLTPDEGVTLPESMTGVAPDAQLVLMKVASDSGNMPTYVVLKALDDAVKLDICAINISLGITYATPEIYDVYTKNIDAAVKAGITVNVAAGNKGIGYARSGISADRPDYGTSNVPALNSKSTSVGSVNNNYIADLGLKTYFEYDMDGQISWFSSYGVSDSLELKPEISAPGGMILSAIPDNEYRTVFGYISGTSMSAPHMTGITALMNEYFVKNSIDISGPAKVARIENMLMSAADIVRQTENGVPFSPRAQGAGVVNTKNAMLSPVIIIGDNGKTKLSLGEINNSFDLSFTLQNLTDEPVVYDKITVDVLADKAVDGMVTGVSERLSFDCDISDEIEVSGNGTAEFKTTVALDDDELAERLETFTNGFFVDGFVSFENGDEPTISIPFTGFYGDWTAATVFDATMYDDGGSEITGASDMTGTYLLTDVGKKTVKNGSFNGVFDRSRVSVSPNGDGNADNIELHISPMRTIKTLGYRLSNNVNPKRSIGGEISDIIKYRGQDIILFEKITNMPDGEYTLTLTGTYPYSGDTADTATIPVTIDTTIPEITDIEVSGSTVTVSAKDENYINEINMYYTDSSGDVIDTRELAQTQKGQISTEVFTVPDGMDSDTVYFEIVDNAFNTTKLWLQNVGKVAAYLNGYTGLDTMTSAKINLLNTDSQQITADVIVAYYDSDGRLVAVDKEDGKTLDAYTNTPLTSNIFEDTRDATQLRLFIWGENIIPLDRKKCFGIK